MAKYKIIVHSYGTLVIWNGEKLRDNSSFCNGLKNRKVKEWLKKTDNWPGIGRVLEDHNNEKHCDIEFYGNKADYDDLDNYLNQTYKCENGTVFYLSFHSLLEARNDPKLSKEIMYQEFNYFKKAAHQGNDIFQAKLGLCYDLGLGVEQNKSEAVKWYRKAAEQGNIEAQLYLANAYGYGCGVKQDPKEAIFWWEKIAGRGYTPAQCIIADLYMYGYGVNLNMREAIKWFKKAAEQGNMLAQYRLACEYYMGRAYEEAIKWYKEAAKKGGVEAQVCLGWCYMNGVGVEKDPAEAKKWYEKAASQGHPYAKEQVSSFSDS